MCGARAGVCAHQHPVFNDVDFTGSILSRMRVTDFEMQFARLDFAKLDGARFVNGDMRWSQLYQARWESEIWERRAPRRLK